MNPILLDLGFLQIRYYGLMYALGILIAYGIIKRDMKWAKLNVDEDLLFNILMLTFLGGLLGARLYYVVFNLDHYTSPQVPWWEFLAVWHGGLAIHGGLIFGPLSLYLLCKHHKIPFGVLCDLTAPTLLLAQALGRIGNLMNGDAHGYPTDLPWGMVFQYGPAAHEYPNTPLHPVMLYESLLNLIGFFILFSLRKKGYKPGFITALYMLVYAVNRFIASFFRADDLYIAGLRAPHVMSFLGLALGLVLIFGLKLHQKQEPPKKQKQYKPSRKWDIS